MLQVQIDHLLIHLLTIMWISTIKEYTATRGRIHVQLYSW